MEFKLWGSIDENGQLVSVQSSCSQANSPTPGSQYDLPQGIPGERKVPYAEKKELVYRLHDKIDEMAVLMVQVGEYSKRLDLQGRLIKELEEKNERQAKEIERLKAENARLQASLRNDRGFGMEDESFSTPTSPKTVVTSIAFTCDVTSSASSDAHVTSWSRSGSTGSDTSYKEVHSRGEDKVDGGSSLSSAQRPCSCPLPGPAASEYNYTEVRKAQLTPDGCTRAHETLGSGIATQRNARDYYNLPHVTQETHRNDSSSGIETLNIDGSENEQSCVSGAKTCSSDNPPDVDDTGYLVLPSCKCHGNQNDGYLCMEHGADGGKKQQAPSRHVARNTHYNEIPDECVSDRPPIPVPRARCVSGSEPDPSRLSDPYEARPPMPVPLGSTHIKAEVRVTQRNFMEESPKQDGGIRSEVQTTVDRKPVKDPLIHRHSSPDLRKDEDDMSNYLLKIMRTTQEWNQAKRRMLDQNTRCTVNMAENSLKRAVQEIHRTCQSHTSNSKLRHHNNQSLLKAIRVSNRKSFEECGLADDFLHKVLDLLNLAEHARSK